MARHGCGFGHGAYTHGLRLLHAGAQHEGHEVLVMVENACAENHKLNGHVGRLQSLLHLLPANAHVGGEVGQFGALPRQLELPFLVFAGQGEHFGALG